ncbi:MAG: PqqD family protein [Planctomycetes bacterium]|nr:PqqD family protein [Planctomycetota bacterium]
MTSIPFTAKMRVSQDVLVQELDGEAVLLHLQTGKYFGLNSMGFRMWQLLVSSHSAEDAYTALAGEYDVDLQTLRHDLDRLLGQLVDERLLDVSR